MTRHIHEWLGAYLDGELQGSRIQQVEAHLAECPACQTELASLENLSRLVKEVPAPQFPSPERLAAQIALRLPNTRVTRPGARISEIGWWLIPVGLLAAWVFVGTSFFISGLLTAAGIPGWLALGSETQAFWSSLLGQFGLLSGNSLRLAASTEAVTRSILPGITLQASIALLYLGWLAVWWTRHTRPGHGRLLEG